MQKSDATDLIERQFSLINVPSKGRYYEDGKSYFLIRHLSFIEENILTNVDLMNTEEGIKMVLRSLMIDDFDVEKLLPGDVQSISMFLYSTAYGDKIEMEVKCPFCSVEEKKDVHISRFHMKEVETWPDSNRKLSSVLPVSKKQFGIRIPTFFEEFRFKLERDNKESHIDRISFLIEELDGETDTTRIRSAINVLPIRDSRFLRTFIEKNTPGVDTKIQHECVSCHSEYNVHVSSGHNFLRLPESYVNSMLEEIYLVARHGDNISWDEAKRMSTSQRKWVLQRIQQDNKKKNDQESSDASKLKNKSKRIRK